MKQLHKLEWNIAWRYFLAKKKDSVLRIINAFAMIGIMLGVATLIIVMAVMKGYESQLTARIIGINAHLSVQSRDGYLQQDELTKLNQHVANLADVVYQAPVLQEKGLAISALDSAGIVVRGMRSNDLMTKPIMQEAIVQGSAQALEEGGSVLVGTSLARRLGLYVGSQLKLVNPSTSNTIFGMVPRIKTYQVVGVFDVGMYEYNSTNIFMSLQDAQIFFDKEGLASEYEIQLAEANRTTEVKKQLLQSLDDDLYIVDWMQNNPLFSALATERVVMMMVLMLIVIVAAFNIISSLTILVKDKAQDVAVLRAFGMPSSSILRIFILCGLGIGLVGTVLGLIVALVFCHYINEIKSALEWLTGSAVFDPVIYYLTNLPVELDFYSIFMILIFAITTTLLATVYPALRAAAILPAKVLRNN
jgi:lipoprotein-releasing system permease protein